MNETNLLIYLLIWQAIWIGYLLVVCIYKYENLKKFKIKNYPQAPHDKKRELLQTNALNKD